MSEKRQSHLTPSEIDEAKVDSELERRPRSPTLHKLKMFAEVFRKKEHIREQVKNGTYSVDSTAIAQSLVQDEGGESDDE